MASNGSHIVLFPFMSKGHTIPLLHLARLLLRRFPLAAVTVFTTPANCPFIDRSLAGTAASVITIPFPHGIPQIPTSAESTDQLPSTSLFPAFATATALMQPRFEAELEKLLPVQLLVSDGFLWWTLESANRFGIPRMAFCGMSNYASSMSKEVATAKAPGMADDDEPFTVAAFPWIKVTRNIVELPDPQSNPVHFEFLMKAVQSMINSYGLLVNSFEELERAFLDYWNRESKPRAWCIGPLCLVDPPEPIPDPDKPTWVRWLDQKLDEGAPVLYVAFGSQAEISAQQLNEIAVGLEKSGAHFLWVIRKKEEQGLGDGFEETVKDRGLVVRDWVDQRSTLMHPSVQGFLSHCGWNSVLESICAGVPILAWPVMADQPLNAKMVDEELRIGLRIVGPPFREGEGSGLVRREEVERKVQELMAGAEGKEARRKVVEIAEAARRAVEEGGSSWNNVNSLINELCK